jgi:type I restriction enzyme R subunit
MSVGQREIKTQRRVIAFLHDALGYTDLGHWKDRAIKQGMMQQLLTGRVRLVKPALSETSA